MQATIKTRELQRMASQVSRGVGNSKILPVTQYLQLQVEGNRLDITATNTSTYVTARGLVDDPQSGTIVVKADQFLKLCGKIDVEAVRLASTDKSLTIHANGTYRQAAYAEMPFPVWQGRDLAPLGELNSTVLKKALRINQAGVSDDLIQPQLTGYWWGDKLVTTDNTRCCVTKIELTMAPPRLMSGGLADLLLQFLDDETVTIEGGDHCFQFTAPSLQVRGPELFGIEGFPVVSRLVNRQRVHTRTLQRGSFLSALERVHLFTDPMRGHGLLLKWEDGGLEVGDLDWQTHELVPTGGVGRGQHLVNSSSLLTLMSALEQYDALLVAWEDNEEPIMMAGDDDNVRVLLSTLEAAAHEA